MQRCDLKPSKECQHRVRFRGRCFRLLQQTANSVRRGELEARSANCIGYLGSIALNGLAQCAPASSGSIVQFVCVEPSGKATYPSCQEGKNPDGTDCIACQGSGTLDLSEVPNQTRR